MSNNFFSSGLGKFLQWLNASIIAIIGFLTSLTAFINLAIGNAGLFTNILLVIGIGILLLSCAYIYFKKKPGVITPLPTPEYPQRIRRLALIGLFLVPILSFSGWRYYIYVENLPPENIIVLVAEFEGPDPKNYRVTETIVRQLRQQVEGKYKDVKIEALKKSITEQDGSTVARDEGKKRKASIVIWGWYGTRGETVPLSANFEILRSPDVLSVLGQEVFLPKPTIPEQHSIQIKD